VTYLHSVAGGVTSVVILGGINAMPDAAANLIVNVLKGA
jgi:hypothetical protein